MPIEIKDLHYTYSPNMPFASVALDGINLTVNDGDFLGIIGHTGSGKSTLLQHLNGLIKLQRGEISVNGMRLEKRYDYKKLRATVGMVFQYPEYQLFDQTVARDVGFGPRNLGLSAAEVEERVKSAIELVGLDYEEFKDRSPFELSGGQKRRVALAGVIAMRPSILVLDEPTAGLDPRGKREILALIRRIKEATAHTVVMISHNMDEVAEQCSRIVVMNHGKIVYDMLPSALFRHAAELQAIGLDIPAVVEIKNKLIERGFSIPETVYRRAELVEALKSSLPQGGAQ